MYHVTTPLKAAVNGGEAMLTAMQTPEFRSVSYLARRSGVQSRLLAEGRPIAEYEVDTALDKAGIKNTSDRVAFKLTLSRLGLTN